MNKLTDLQLCKRIAEINGDNVLMMKSALGSNWMIAGEGHGGYKPYNPLTDDALCFQLMIKYNMPLMKSGAPNLYECIFDMDRALSGAGIICDESPNRAICLAIIGAHKND